jgi:hypothetical protein
MNRLRRRRKKKKEIKLGCARKHGAVESGLASGLFMASKSSCRSNYSGPKYFHSPFCASIQPFKEDVVMNDNKVVKGQRDKAAEDER